MSFQKIFNRFKKNKQIAHTPLEPIPWRDVIRECYDKKLSFAYPVVEVIYTDDKSERAAIIRKSERLYSIVYEKLYPYNEDELKYFALELHGYWAPIGKGSSFFETEEDAIKAIYSDVPFKNNKCIID